MKLSEIFEAMRAKLATEPYTATHGMAETVLAELKRLAVAVEADAEAPKADPAGSSDPVV